MANVLIPYPKKSAHWLFLCCILAYNNYLSSG